MTPANDWSAARRLLCVRLDAMGDVLMTTPALRALKESAPDRHLTLMTSPAGAEVARLIPEVDDVWIYDAPWVKATAPRASAAPDWVLLRRLQAARFDGAIIFTVFSQNPLPAALACYLAGIPRRLAHCRENPYQLLTHWVKDPEIAGPIRHEVQRQLDLAATIGCRTEKKTLAITVSESARQKIIERLQAAGICLTKPWVVLHPGASAPSRRYPAELYAEVVARLSGRLGWQIIFTGQADEQSLIDSIAARAEGSWASFAGALSLAELCALISLARLLLCNNTGPAHIAAAVGTPVVSLYALTNPQHQPWRVPSRVLSHDVPCKYCYKSVCPEGHLNCLRQISPEDVVLAARDLSSEVLCTH